MIINHPASTSHIKFRHFLAQAQGFAKFAVAPIFALFVWGNSALADTGLVRAADTVLVVSGNTSAESSQGIVFDMAALQNLPSTKITTSNPWIKGAAEFTGVRISALLESVGAQTNDIEARAANEYKFKLTGIDFDKYPIIIAYLKDGNPMEFRELGPLWIIFPFDDFPELLTSKNKAASVWQLTDIEVL